MGTPARLELDVGSEGMTSFIAAAKAMSPGSDFTSMLYLGSDGGSENIYSGLGPELVFRTIVDLVKRGTIREYKRIICFDNSVLANDPALK